MYWNQRKNRRYGQAPASTESVSEGRERILHYPNEYKGQHIVSITPLNNGPYETAEGTSQYAADVILGNGMTLRIPIRPITGAGSEV